MTYEQALNKLTAICARGEHCLQEMLVKMDRWQIDDDTKQRVLAYLVKEHYIDEERYARFFINDKMKYNHWGKRKIEQSLYIKRIPKEIYAHLLESFNDEAYTNILMPLLHKKRNSMKEAYGYEAKMKLIRFAMQRGFSYEQAEQCLEKIYK